MRSSLVGLLVSTLTLALVLSATAGPEGTVSTVQPTNAAPAPAAAPQDGERLEFNRDIRPILSNNCFHCHGFDPSTREADLRLDTREGATRDLGGYFAIVPGKPDESELLKRVHSDDVTEMMPPRKSGKKLTDAEKHTLRRWIEQGAEYEPHWSFVAPKKGQPPKVKREDWARNDIDRFVLARLEREGLSPSPEADRRTLIRRVTFDLTGLPPTPQEVEDFVNDTAPNAYEKVVERLLASPRFGEHRARYWLDTVRYADTHGLHFDNYREIWPYRDYVIHSFNANKPFDRFTIEQIAGDMLPDTTLEQQIASGYNRLHVTTNEGGSIEEEVYVRNVVDRVESTATVFLGLTMGCAVCHDHKYDPISMRDVYSMFAIFNVLDDKPMDGNKKAYAPVVKVPTPEQSEQLAGLQREIDALHEQIRKSLAESGYEDPGPSPEQAEAVEFVWVDDATPDGAKPGAEWAFVQSPDPVLSGQRAVKDSNPGLSQHDFKDARPIVVDAEDVLFAHVYLVPGYEPKQIMLQWNDGTWEHRAYWGGNHIHQGKNGTASRKRMGDLPEAGKWVRLEVKARDVGLGKSKPVHGLAFAQFGGTVLWDKAGYVEADGGGFDSLQQWTQFAAKQNKPRLPQRVIDAARLEPEKRNDQQNALLREHFLRYVYKPTRESVAKLDEQVKKKTDTRNRINSQVATSLVSREKDEPRDAFILLRGQYDQRGEKVERSTPAALSAWSPDLPRNRLGFAQWLVDSGHPLTARVTVNRFWAELFGAGLVRTPEDFGSQGEQPTHPELFDTLAVQFIEDGWNVKNFYRRVVLSATYRQSSRVTPTLRERDPSNKLLARGPRHRLDAEMLRDQALAVSGLLVEKLGGPPVKPPQPPGLWKAVGYVGSDTMLFKADTGPDKVHRRSVYTFYKRTAPAPQMTTFDAPSREACTVQRERTNTPLQALLLLNDPQYVEAARSLAQRAIKEGGDTAESRVTHLFYLATGRHAGESELRVMIGSYEEHLSHYRGKAGDAQKLIAIGDPAVRADAAIPPEELAAMTLVANLVLNTDEVINKS